MSCELYACPKLSVKLSQVFRALVAASLRWGLKKVWWFKRGLPRMIKLKCYHCGSDRLARNGLTQNGK